METCHQKSNHRVVTVMSPAPVAENIQVLNTSSLHKVTEARNTKITSSRTRWFGPCVHVYMCTCVHVIVKWSEKWQMLFNFEKCKCLHTGHGNLDVNYKMGDTVLGTTVKEKDLEVTISADMKVSEQCGIAASKGNQILGMIRRNITYKGKK